MDKVTDEEIEAMAIEELTANDVPEGVRDNPVDAKKFIDTFLLRKKELFIKGFKARDKLTPVSQPVTSMVEEKENYEFIKYPQTKDWIVKEDNICPATKEQCDDECCPPGSICNLHPDNTDKLTPPTSMVEGEKLYSVEDLKNAFDAGYDYRSSLLPEIIKEFGDDTTPNFDSWLKEL